MQCNNNAAAATASNIMYPDEAVVEMEAEQRAGERRRHLEDLRHLLLDDGLHARARAAVEIHVQPCGGSRRKDDEHSCNARHDHGAGRHRRRRHGMHGFMPSKQQVDR